jgi:hypothetical protein
MTKTKEGAKAICVECSKAASKGPDTVDLRGPKGK